jgi:hypothetical protein
MPWIVDPFTWRCALPSLTTAPVKGTAQAPGMHTPFCEKFRRDGDPVTILRRFASMGARANGQEAASISQWIEREGQPEGTDDGGAGVGGLPTSKEVGE